MSDVIVNTCDTLALIQRAQQHPDLGVRLAADSVLSALVLHLKHATAVLPQEMKVFLDVLKRAS